MIELFQEWYENHHEYAREWKKKTGGRVLGYIGTAVPEEILHAAAMLPVRILGSHEPRNVTESLIPGMDCPFCRNCLTQGLQGCYDYLDGLLISHSCQHLRQAFTRWQRDIPIPYSYSLPLPLNVQSPRAFPDLAAELAAFQKSIEDWIGKKIADADLDRGIEIMNESRRLLRQAFETRKKDNPPLTGLEALYLSVSGQWIDKREHNRVLKDVLEKELPTRDLKLGNQLRLMILGNEDDDTEFVKMVESLEATFVIDDHGPGTRYFWNEVLPADDRLAAIAARYLDRPPCPAKDRPLPRRLDPILKLAKDWRVQGAIIIQQKFCDPHELNIPAIRKALDGVGVPCLFLELDVTIPWGQFKIRVESFLEMLRPEDLF